MYEKNGAKVFRSEKLVVGMVVNCFWEMVDRQKCQPHKMVKHPNNSSAVADEFFECVDHFVELALKGLSLSGGSHLLTHSPRWFKFAKNIMPGLNDEVKYVCKQQLDWFYS